MAHRADRWFYAHDDKKIGPFSGQQLRDLADSRQILPTDTVWKEGIEKGVFATKVRYLFSSAQTETPPASASVQVVVQAAAAPLTSEIMPILAELKTAERPDEVKPEETPIAGAPAAETLPDNIQLQPEAKAPVSPKQPSAPQFSPRKRSAVAVKGAIIVSQDGVKVRFKKKCGKCGHEETAWSMLPITDGMMRTNYFCPKCRKKEDVVIRGSLH